MCCCCVYFSKRRGRRIETDDCVEGFVMIAIPRAFLISSSSFFLYINIFFCYYLILFCRFVIEKLLSAAPRARVCVVSLSFYQSTRDTRRGRSQSERASERAPARPPARRSLSLSDGWRETFASFCFNSFELAVDSAMANQYFSNLLLSIDGRRRRRRR